MTRDADVTSYDAALDGLAHALAATSFAALDAATVTAARQRAFDTLAATALGLCTPEGKALQAGGNGHGHTPPPLTPRVAAQIELLVGATRTTEVDDIDIASCVTAGAVVVPVALALANAGNDDDRKLLAAIVAGYEAMLRLGRAIGGATILYRGIWPTYVTAAFGAAATAAKLLELDAEATSRALALALTATSVPPVSAFADFAARYRALGAVSAAGAAAAKAAAAGGDADPNALEHFATRLEVRVDTAEILREATSRWLIHDVDTKMFPTSRQSLASVEAFLSLGAELDSHEDIERVIVHVPGIYRDMVDRPTLPSQRIESMTGVQYAMALALFAPEALYDAMRTALRSDTRIAELIGKIEVRASPQLDTLFPRTWGSTVTVHRSGGRVATQELLEPAGDRAQPLDWRKLGRKVARIFAASGLANAQFVNRLLERCRLLAETEGARSAEELIAIVHAAGRWPKLATDTGARIG